MNKEMLEKLASDVVNRIFEKLAGIGNEDLGAQYSQINTRSKINQNLKDRRMLGNMGGYTGGTTGTSQYNGAPNYYKKMWETKNMGQGAGTPDNAGGWGNSNGYGGQFSVPQSMAGQDGQRGTNTYQMGNSQQGNRSKNTRAQGQPVGQASGQPVGQTSGQTSGGYQTSYGQKQYAPKPQMTFQSAEMPSQGIASRMFSWFSGNNGSQTAQPAKSAPVKPAAANGGIFNWFAKK